MLLHNWHCPWHMWSFLVSCRGLLLKPQCRVPNRFRLDSAKVEMRPPKRDQCGWNRWTWLGVKHWKCAKPKWVLPHMPLEALHGLDWKGSHTFTARAKYSMCYWMLTLAHSKLISCAHAIEIWTTQILAMTVILSHFYPPRADTDWVG